MAEEDLPDPDAVVHVPIGPELDLHSFQPRDVSSVVDAFIIAANEAGLSRVRIIHGRGVGVQRAMVQHLLDRHPLVAAFEDDPDSHLGATFADLTPPD